MNSSEKTTAEYIASPGRADIPSGGIRVQGLFKSFDEKHVLNGLDLFFPYDKITCLMGPSGCGKTTLFRIFMGFEKADAGTVTGIPERISAVFQENRLAEDFSVLSNILMPLEPETAREAEQAKQKALDLMQKTGLDVLPQQKVRELSGGMKRRVAILRALMPESDLLLLDEPLKGLDEKNRNSVIDVLRSCKGTILVITHDPEEARLLGAEILRM